MFYKGLQNGANKIRTCDLLHAMQALSQLSYGPVSAGIVANHRLICKPQSGQKSAFFQPIANPAYSLRFCADFFGKLRDIKLPRGDSYLPTGQNAKSHKLVAVQQRFWPKFHPAKSLCASANLKHGAYAQAGQFANRLLQRIQILKIRLGNNQLQLGKVEAVKQIASAFEQKFYMLNLTAA